MDPCIQRARSIIAQEAEAVSGVAEHVNETFVHVTEMILGLGGRVVTTGMGKAGIIAEKISATFSSTGTPSIFLHPAEAVHGDLGRIAAGDLLLALSKSGETEEVLRLVGPVKAVGVSIIAITQSEDSALGRHADHTLELGRIEEVGRYRLAPSASTIAMLALGDALALIVQEGRSFGPEDFARYHPGGDLGRQLMKVKELMRTEERNPQIQTGATLLETIEVMTTTSGRPGATSVVDDKGALIGFFTDGDLRRLLATDPGSLSSINIEDVMITAPRTISPDAFATEALALLHKHHIDQIPVADQNNCLLGLLDVQDLLDLKIG